MTCVETTDEKYFPKLGLKYLSKSIIISGDITKSDRSIRNRESDYIRIAKTYYIRIHGY